MKKLIFFLIFILCGHIGLVSAQKSDLPQVSDWDTDLDSTWYEVIDTIRGELWNANPAWFDPCEKCGEPPDSKTWWQKIEYIDVCDTVKYGISNDPIKTIIIINPKLEMWIDCMAENTLDKALAKWYERCHKYEEIVDSVFIDGVWYWRK
jgi:hypothetical protein